jgi:hypothetical protein
MVSMAFNRWVCRPRILGSVAVLSLAYYAFFMGVVPKQWKDRFGRKGEAIDESLKAVLNETLGVSFLIISSFRVWRCGVVMSSAGALG